MAKGAARRAHGEVQRAKIKSQKAEVASSEMLLNQVLHPDKKRMVPLVKTKPSNLDNSRSEFKIRKMRIEVSNWQLDFRNLPTSGRLEIFFSFFPCLPTGH